MTKGGKKMGPLECAIACVRAGRKYVLVSNGRVFQSANQGLPDLEKQAGHKGRITGKLASDNKTITVAKIQITQ